MRARAVVRLSGLHRFSPHRKDRRLHAGADRFGLFEVGRPPVRRAAPRLQIAAMRSLRRREVAPRYSGTAHGGAYERCGEVGAGLVPGRHHRYGMAITAMAGALYRHHSHGMRVGRVRCWSVPDRATRVCACTRTRACAYAITGMFTCVCVRVVRACVRAPSWIFGQRASVRASVSLSPQDSLRVRNLFALYVCRRALASASVHVSERACVCSLERARVC
jgi:hypothetical protein